MQNVRHDILKKHNKANKEYVFKVQYNSKGFDELVAAQSNIIYC